MATSQPAQPAGTYTDERRKDSRINVLRPRPISVDVADQTASGFLVDVSDNGLALQSLIPLKRGARRTLFFKPDQNVSIEVSTEVVWTRDGKAGLRVVNMEDHSRAAFRQWIDGLRALELPVEESVPDNHQAAVVAPAAFSPPQEDLYSAVARARVLTCANGAAIAWSDGEHGLVCRASSGDAPPSGVRVQTEQGLSGECIRTGNVVRCDDTETDQRVDPEVCRQLNLRSAAIAPVRREGKIVGLIEVFSSKPQAFNEEDISGLQLIAAAIAHPHAEPEQDVANVPMRGFATVQTPATPSRLTQLTEFSSRLKIIAPLALGASLLLGVGIYFAVRSPSTGKARQSLPPQISAAPVSGQQDFSSSAPATADVTNTPPTSSTRTSQTGRRSRSPSPQQANAINTAGEQNAQDTLAASIPIQPGPGTSSRSSAAAPPEVAAPDLAQPAGKSDDRIASVLGASSTSMPLLTPGATISHVSPGRVIHKVNPQYPAAARNAHRQGLVVLRITVAKDGHVKNVRVVEGDPDLARAALDAVYRWRYEPYKIDGAPVDVDAEVRMSFSLDQKAQK